MTEKGMKKRHKPMHIKPKKIHGASTRTISAVGDILVLVVIPFIVLAALQRLKKCEVSK